MSATDEQALKCTTNPGTGDSGFTVPFVDLATHTRSFLDEAETAIREVALRASFILGEDTTRFEDEFSAYLGVKYAIGVGNGLDALRLALESLEVGAGDEVIAPANTFIATALAIHGVGATPVFVDCDPQTYGIESKLVESAVTPRTRAIIPVHLAGRAADMKPLLDIAKQHGLKIVEDVAQAPGAKYELSDGTHRHCGALANAGCFSFYPGKNLGCWGDGGLVATDDQNLADKLRQLRHYGQKVRYQHTVKGCNSRLDTLQAAILRIKLPRLDDWNAKRILRAQRYRELLAEVADIEFHDAGPRGSHVYHLFVIETDQRDKLHTHLTQAGIETLIHYPRPIHLQPAFADLGYKAGDFPCAERAARRMLSLPIYPELSDEQQDHVADAIRKFFQ